MRIRLPFAGIFFLLLVLAGYAGLTSLQLDGIINDKILHFVTFFLLTVAFYWIVDTNRRRTLNMALAVCTGGLGVGSELLQALIPNNGRVFDVFDIAANIVGSLAALGLCSWYHKRMLERKRLRKYTAVPGEEGEEDGDGENGRAIDVELGEGVTHSTVLHDGDDDGSIAGNTATDTPVTTPASTTAGSASAGPATATTPTKAPTATATHTRSLDEELDNWDENAEDPWAEDDSGDIGGKPTKKRTD